MAGDPSDLYQDLILDHSKNPRNAGPLDGATHQARGNNPLCGDRITVYLTLDGDQIADVKFEARGCAISVASASMMSEMIKGKTVEEATALFEKFHALVTGGTSGEGDGLEELESLAGVRDFPTRIKCATLSWHAMQQALRGAGEEVRTE